MCAIRIRRVRPVHDCQGDISLCYHELSLGNGRERTRAESEWQGNNDVAVMETDREVRVV